MFGSLLEEEKENVLRGRAYCDAISYGSSRIGIEYGTNNFDIGFRLVRIRKQK